MQYGAEKLSLPTGKGWDWRFHNGGGYLTLLLVKSEEEKQRREKKFRTVILPFIQVYDGKSRLEAEKQVMEKVPQE